MSNTMLENWIPTTDLPGLMDLSPADLTRSESSQSDQDNCRVVGGLRFHPCEEKRERSAYEWKYKSQEIAAAERSHGKYLLFSTDESLSPDEVVKAYFENELVEKVFRTLKTSEEMEPVCHRLERRVRVYIFVCVLAYRLLADLKWRLQKLPDHKNVWHEADAFLHDPEPFCGKTFEWVVNGGMKRCISA